MSTTPEMLQFHTGKLMLLYCMLGVMSLGMMVNAMLLSVLGAVIPMRSGRRVRAGCRLTEKRSTQHKDDERNDRGHPSRSHDVTPHSSPSTNSRSKRVRMQRG